MKKALIFIMMWTLKLGHFILAINWGLTDDIQAELVLLVWFWFFCLSAVTLTTISSPIPLVDLPIYCSDPVGNSSFLISESSGRGFNGFSCLGEGTLTSAISSLGWAAFWPAILPKIKQSPKSEPQKP